MTKSSQLYVFAAVLAVFLVTWTAVLAHPWGAAPPDPRIAALDAREQRLRRESTEVRALVDRRWASYRVALQQRNAANGRAVAAQRQLFAAPTPPVRIITLPPLVITSTS